MCARVAGGAGGAGARVDRLGRIGPLGLLALMDVAVLDGANVLGTTGRQLELDAVLIEGRLQGRVPGSGSSGNGGGHFGGCVVEVNYEVYCDRDRVLAVVIVVDVVDVVPMSSYMSCLT